MRQYLLTPAAAVLIFGMGLGIGEDRVAGPHGTIGVTPNNWTLAPAGVQIAVGDRPLGAALSPDGRYLAVSNDGQGVQSLALVDVTSRRLVQTLPYHAPDALYAGLAWTSDGRRLFASAGGNNLVRTYDMREGHLTEGPPITLAPARARIYPAGLAVTPEGHTLLVVENLANSLVAIDSDTGTLVATARTGTQPYGVAVSPEDGKVYVSNWGDRTVTVLGLPALAPKATVTVGLHPGALALDAPRRRLYVANADDDSVSILDTQSDRVIATLSVSPYPEAPEGSIPDGLAPSADGRWLFIANAGNNDVAVADLSGPSPRLVGLIPTAWYPTTVTVSHDGHTLYVTNAKGLGTGPNPRGPSPAAPVEPIEVQYLIVAMDDAQNGHVDAHRTIALLAGANVRRRVVDHTFSSTVSLLRTIELIPGIPPMTQYDAAAQPLLSALTDEPAPFSYAAVMPGQSLVAVNPPTAPGAAESLLLPLDEADEAPSAVFNRILWRAIKGNVPLPASRTGIH